MPSYYPPKINTEYVTYVSLVSQADTKVFQSNPTIASGDFQVSTDGGALANLTTLPVVTPTSSKMVKITLSAAEMNGDVITVVCSDASGAEWCDLTFTLFTTANQIDDLATSEEVNAIATVGGGAINYDASEDNVSSAIKSVSFVGVQTSGTFASTSSPDGTYHVIDDTGNAIDIVYGFDVGGASTATQVVFQGYLDGSNDTLNVQAYDFDGTTWDSIGILNGQNGTANVNNTYILFQRHTGGGTGADLGKVYIRFQNTSQTNPQLNVDSLVTAAVAKQSILYENGAVWVDSNASNTNTESFVDGTAGNPVSTMAAAKTIADNLNLKKFEIESGSSVTLNSAFSGYTFLGHEYSLDINGQDITNTFIEQANILAATSVGTGTIFSMCIFDANVTLTPCVIRSSFFGNITITASSAGNFYINNCRSRVAGSNSPNFDFGSALNASNLSMRDYSGGIELENMGAGTGTYNASIEGTGQITINANCSATSNLSVRGLFSYTDNAGGAVTLTDDARYNSSKVNAEVVDALNIDTYGEVSSVPAATSSLVDKIRWMFTRSRNKFTQTATTKTLRNDADSADVATAAHSDDGTTYTQDEWS